MYSPVDLYCWHPDWCAAGPGQFFVCDESLIFRHYTKHHNPRPDTVLPAVWWIVGEGARREQSILIWPPLVSSQLGICQFFSRAGGEKGLCSDRLEAVAFTRTKKIDYEQLYRHHPIGGERKTDRKIHQWVSALLSCAQEWFTLRLFATHHFYTNEV